MKNPQAETKSTCTLKALIKKPNHSSPNQIGREVRKCKPSTKNILIEKKFKKAFKGKKKCKQELLTFQKIDVSEFKGPTYSLEENNVSSGSGDS